MPHRSPTPSPATTATAIDRAQPSRRDAVRRLAYAACAVASVPAWGALAGCSAAPAAGAAASSGADVASSTWASGGTARISGAVRALNPFAAASASRCALTCEATIGPCHTSSPERVDVSDGWDGLPLHLQIRIVDAACQPVVGAMVEMWHTNHTGGYSGQIAPMCNNNAADTAQQFFRGWQRTNAQGVVHFDSCYPGWYHGRANHIHLRVLKGDYNGADEAPSWLTTQLLFSDALNSAIFTQQPLYLAKGQPDTHLDADGVIGNEPDKSPYLLDVQNVDGVMLASKTLVIRSSLGDAVCEARGKMPPGPPPGMGGRPGMPPPGFQPGGPRPPMPPGGKPFGPPPSQP